MSIFGDIADGISSFFGGGSNVAGLVGTGLSLIGNENAAGTVAAGNQQAVNAIQGADSTARNDVLSARDQATGTLQPFVAAGAPARSYLQQIMTTDPSKLTPMQRIGLDDLTRRTENNLSVSGLRGAGYGGQGVLGDATQRYLAGAFNTNQARSDAAASTLNNQGYGASQGTANIDLGTGSNLASIGIGEGNAIGNLARSTADTRAGATLADTRAIAGGIGSLTAKSGAPGSTGATTPTGATTATPTPAAGSNLTTGPALSDGGGGLSSVGQLIDQQQRTTAPFQDFQSQSGG